MIHRICTKTISFAAGQTESEVIRLSGETKILGFFTDAALTTADLTFKTSPADILKANGADASAPGTYYPLYDDGGNIIKVTDARASRGIVINQIPIILGNWVQLVSSTAQVAATTLTLVVQMA